MRKLTTMFAVAAMAVGTFALTGCEKEDTMTTPTDTGTGTMETGTMESDTMATDPATTAPTTAPATPPAP